MTVNGQRSWESIAGGVVATAGPLVAAGVGWGADVPGWAPAALAVAGTAGVALRTWKTRQPWSELAFKAGVGVTSAGWTAWSTMTGPWHLLNLVAGAGAALLGLAVAPAFVAEGTVVPDQPGRAGMPETKAPTSRAAVWAARIEQQARVKNITVTDEDWPKGGGFTLHVAFQPGSGDSWTAIRDAAHRIAAAARLPKGCVISAEEGDLQGTAVVRIPTVYALAGDVPMPDDTSTLSIWDDLPIGVHEDGTTAAVNLRQASGLIAGRRGGGKTNLLKVLISQLLRCDNSLVWVADLNGGGLAVPFMLASAKRELSSFPIDWVAADPEEVVLMATVAAAIAKDRKARYAALTAEAGGDLLPVTRDLPQITIVVDESAEVEDDPAAREAMNALRKVQRIGRAEAVNVVFSALRATQDTIPVSVRKQSALKLCGPVEDDTELEYMLPGARVRSADLVHPGTFFLRRGDAGAAVRQIKVFRTLPDKIRHGVMATDGRRPSLDPAGQQVGGRIYAERMQRLQPWLDRLAGRAPSRPEQSGLRSGTDSPLYGLHQLVQAGVVDVDEETGQTLARGAAIAERGSRPEDREAQRARARDGLRRMAQRIEVQQMPKDKLDDVFGALVADLRPSEDDGIDGAGWRPELLLDLAGEAGPEGIGPTEMQRVLASRGIKVSMKTVNKHLPKYVAEGKLRNEGGRYFPA